MDVVVKCPKCGDEMVLDSSRVGSEFDCPGCGEAFTVLNAEPVVPDAGTKSGWKSKLNDGTVVAHIGSCAGTEDAVNHLTAVLAVGGIWVGTEGSKGYTIFVRDADAGKAKAPLRSDPEKARFHVTVYPD